MSNSKIKSSSVGKVSHKWQEVKKYVMAQMSNGKYSPGDVLPSENYLCDKVNVSRSTVRQAIKELENDGMVYRVKGRGTFLSEVNSSKNQTRLEMFGLIMPDIRRSLYPSLTQGFDDRLASENFQTMVCQTGNDVDKQGNIILRLLHKGIDGLVVVPSTSGRTPAYQIQMLIDNNIPVVLCHRGVEGVDVPTLYWDRQQVGKMAGKILLDHGHRKIAYYGVYKYIVTEEHVKGLREAMMQAGVELPANHIVFGPNGEIDGEREKILEQLLLGIKPTAVFCNDDDEAERLYWLASKFNIKVPQDLSIIGFGDSHRHSVTREFISSIVVDEYALGREAANLLCQMKSHKMNISNNVKEMVEMNFYYGSSIVKI
jgi:GntR family transcriptional regulator of arabinose operon